MPAPVVKHNYHSAKGDTLDSTFVKPTDWNKNHDITVSQASVMGATAAGAVVELPLVMGTPPDDGTMWTKDAIMEAIAAAVASISANLGIAKTGDICTSMLSAKGGWLLLNGQTIGALGSGADWADPSAHDLFVLFHDGIGGVAWPIIPSRGASAEADWTALKKIALPDARGRALVMPDNGAGVSSQFWLGLPVGEATHTLTAAEMPSHFHFLPDPVNLAARGNLGGVGTGTPIMFDEAHSGQGTSIEGGSQPHNNMQPSIGANMFIKL